MIFWVHIIKNNRLILMNNSTNPLSWDNIWTWGRQSDTGLSSLIASEFHKNNLERTTFLSYIFYWWSYKSQHRKQRSFVCDNQPSDRNIQSCHNEHKPPRRRRDIFVHCYNFKHCPTIIRERCLLWYLIQICVK